MSNYGKDKNGIVRAGKWYFWPDDDSSPTGRPLRFLDADTALVHKNYVIGERLKITCPHCGKHIYKKEAE